ncbi:1-acyl-sn-glycerol-3-phosphate acyltransferase [Sphingomonas ginsenosidimutans]|jgi:1-acyl-sn-glycerol-3-phosphate acyltransferase|uniref:1-acyl-sn-glycerol-3-phosphate acyltransferase n=1 Tax=Sphingomonas ginsenosidimutans TaxID=862134 RepID=A0A2A4HY70_9SPHN|nr:lysophospholipid acyltransferase family protein [Sphingomonas ginsenosidimutans]PCG09320.1 1-acyl-sn-glycerol-3-phosphate acyltransferase [Sphingomonas ginsenosidimutans]
MNALRTYAFRFAFYALSVPVVLAGPLAIPFGRRAVQRYAHGWVRMHRWLARAILGVRVRMEGALYDGPALYVAKHETMFETFELVDRIDGPLIVLKQELLRIPVWGAMARNYGAVAIDREAGGKAMRQLLREGAAVRAAGRSVLIFPEGTRVPHGERSALKPGFVGLYKAMGLPVVPIASDSGRLVPRHGTARPGTLTLRFGTPIPPGLPRAEVEARVHAAINALND